MFSAQLELLPWVQKGDKNFYNEALQDGGETSEYLDVGDLMIRNGILLREARDLVMSGWE